MRKDLHARERERATRLASKSGAELSNGLLTRFTIAKTLRANDYGKKEKRKKKN